MEREEQMVIVIISIIYAGGLLGLVFMKHEVIDKLNDRVKKRIELITLLTTVCCSLVLVIALQNRANKISEEQIKISDRETAPEFEMKKNADKYKVIGKKGMASYITLRRYEHYYFTYRDECYEVNLVFLGKEEDKKMSMDSDNRELVFKMQNKGFNEQSALESIDSYVKERLNEDIKVYSEEYIDLTFFDYKNERLSFRFQQYDDSIELINTEDTTTYAPHNVFNIYRENQESTKVQLQRLVDQLLEMK